MEDHFFVLMTLIDQFVFILTNLKRPIPKLSTHQIPTPPSDASASLISSSRIKILKSPSINTHHMPRTPHLNTAADQVLHTIVPSPAPVNPIRFLQNP